MKKTLGQLKPFQQGSSKIRGVETPIKLSANESPYGPSPKALTVYAQQAEQLHRYPDGTQTELRRAIGAIYKVPVENIICTNGSEEGIGLLMRAFLEAEDEVLVSENGFGMTEIHALSCGAKIVHAPEKNYKVQVDAILKRVSSKTKIVALCNPNNPTGTYLSIAEIQHLQEHLPLPVILMLDAAYAEYVEQGDYDCGLKTLFHPTGRVVVTHTFSKVYGLPALRMGWLACPDFVHEAIQRIRCPFNANAVAMAVAATSVLDVDYTASIVRKNREIRENFCRNLENLGLMVIPTVTNFVFFKFPDPAKNGARAACYLQSKGIIPRPAQKSDQYLRVSIGTAEEMEKVHEALKDYLMFPH